MNKSNDIFLTVQNAINTTRDDAIKILMGEDESLKPYAFLNIDYIKSQDEADLIIHHLTNHPNPTREACAFVLCSIYNRDFFQSSEILNTLKEGICDINPNVCRAVIELLSKNPQLAKLITPLNIKKINELLEEFKMYEKTFGSHKENKMKNRKNHAKNKKLFNLYWCLEALGETMSENEFEDEILKICQNTVNFLDYTIREKTAKILTKMTNPPKELLQKLKNDENFYVKNLVYDKICKDSNNRDTL